MEVELDFAVKEQRYRVIRKRSRATGRRPAQTILDLQIEGPSGFRSIAGSTVNETQRAILDIVRMQYETFVSSAFLLQGHDDLFTVDLKPAERKRLLGEVLGLDVYELLARRAREEGQLRRAEAGQRQRDVTEMERELEVRATLEAERARSEALVAQISADVASCRRPRRGAGSSESWRPSTRCDSNWKSSGRSRNASDKGLRAKQRCGRSD
jgi:exonuclease SbcC